MIEQYLRLKKKGITPNVALRDIPDPLGEYAGPDRKAITLTVVRYDRETGLAEDQEKVSVYLDDFIKDGEKTKEQWAAYKDIYEALTGENWPK